MTTSFGDDDPFDPFRDAAELPPLELADPSANVAPKMPAGPSTLGDDPLEPPSADLAPLELAPVPQPPVHEPTPGPMPAVGAPGPVPGATHVAATSPEAIREAARRKAEAAALAGFGEPPRNPLLALPYTVHVALRAKDLWQSRRRLAERLETAQRRVLATHAALGRALLQHQRADLDTHGLAELAGQAQRALGATDSQRSLAQRTRAEADAEKRRLDEEIARAEAMVAPLRDREAKLRAELDVLSHELRRRTAALDRVKIELRHAPDASPLQASLEARRAEVALQQEKVDAKAGELRDVQSRLAAGLEQLRRHQATRRHLDRELTGSILAAEASVGKATSEAERRLAELGRRARDARVPMGVLEAATAVKADDHVAQLQRELKLHDEALRSWDRRAVAIGGTLLAAFALLMLVVFVLMIT